MTSLVCVREVGTAARRDGRCCIFMFFFLRIEDALRGNGRASPLPHFFRYSATAESLSKCNCSVGLPKMLRWAQSWPDDFARPCTTELSSPSYSVNDKAVLMSIKKKVCLLLTHAILGLFSHEFLQLFTP
jgi:hypothetical protein